VIDLFMNRSRKNRQQNMKRAGKIKIFSQSCYVLWIIFFSFFKFHWFIFCLSFVNVGYQDLRSYLPQNFWLCVRIGKVGSSKCDVQILEAWRKRGRGLDLHIPNFQNNIIWVKCQVVWILNSKNSRFSSRKDSKTKLFVLLNIQAYPQ